MAHNHLPSRAARRRPGLRDQANNTFASSLLNTLVQREVRRVIREKNLDVDATRKLKKLEAQAARQKVQSGHIGGLYTIYR